MMIGREAEMMYLGELLGNHETTVLEVRNLTKHNNIYNASFRLSKGEILGFYGLVGSGRTELAKIIIGEKTADSGEVLVGGEVVNIKSVADALVRYRIGYVSENRKEEGLFLEASVSMNIGITMLPRLRGPLNLAINGKKESELSQKYIDELHIRTYGSEQAVKTLSGGNQQKVSISKWLASECEILIIDEPTIGVDVGAKEQIHHLIWNLAYKQGKSIILISSDLPEMVTLARRILVFRNKKIMGEVNELYAADESLNKDINQRIGSFLI